MHNAQAWRARGLALGGVLVILIAWQVVATVWFTTPSGKPGAVPPPTAVFAEVLADLGDPVYWRALAATAQSALAGFGIGMLIALALGVLVMLVPLLDQFANQIGVLAACLPSAAIAPLIVLLSPVGTRTVSVVLAVLAVLFPATVAVLLGLRSADTTQLDLIRAYGGGAFTEIRRVRAIAAVPSLLTGMKIGVPSAVLGAIVGEFFIVGVDSGLGLLLVAKQYVGDYVGMWAVAVISALTAAVGYLVVAALGRVATPWAAPSGAGAHGGAK